MHMYLYYELNQRYDSSLITFHTAGTGMNSYCKSVKIKTT